MIPKISLHKKVKLNILTAHILAAVGLIFYFSWWGLATAAIMWIIFNYGVSGGFHRLFSHRQYEVNSFWRWFLLISGTLAGIGSCISWVGQHRQHHKNSDVKGLDPYYPHDNWFLAWIFGPWHVNTSPLVVRDLLKDKAQLFLHNHYFKIQILYVSVLALINPELVFWMWALPSAGTFTSLQVVGVFGHLVGEKIYDTKDEGLNSHWLNIFTFGESYQNSHHHDSRMLILGPMDIMGKSIKHVIAKRS